MSRLKEHRPSYFVFTGDEVRVRRPRDIAMTVVGGLLVAWTLVNVDKIPDWAQAFEDFVDSSPQWVTALLAIGYLVSFIYALVVTAGLIATRRERRLALRDLVLVTVITAGLVIAISWLVNEAWPYVLPEIDLQDPVARFPVMRVSLVTAILLVAGPYVTRPLRRFGWFAILVTAFAAIGLTYGTPIHAIGSFGIGMLAAGGLLALVGTPRGYPSPETVRDGLEALGVESARLEPAPNQVWGVVRYDGADEAGRPLEIKVHGRDAFDSQLAAKIWRTMLYREVGGTVSYSRLQAVEHEALVTVVAGGAGVSVPELRAVGTGSSEIALVAFSGGGVELGSVGELTDEVLTAVWENVRALHSANISHGSLGLDAIRVSDQGVTMRSFGRGTLSSDPEDRSADVVELLYSIATLVGPDRAVATALDVMGTEALVEAMPYMQVPVLSSQARRLTEKPKILLSSLSDQVAEVTGADKPEPVPVRRVSWKSLGTLVLLVLVAYALLPLITQVDYAEIWDTLQTASWGLVILGVIIGHLQYFPQTTATMFVVPARLPFWPLFTLQSASQFISLAIPSAAGRVAMNTAFLHKFGVPVPVALTQGAVDGFSGFLVQAVILVVIWLTGGVDLGIDVDTEDINWLLVLGIVVLVVVGAVLLVLRVRKLRERVVPVVRQAWQALLVVLRQPSRAFGLLGSNFVYWNILGLTLWVLLEAMGSPISYGSALFVAAGTNLLAGFMPVPGGLGVFEATMVALLATFGVDQATAFAATACFRVATFFLPALEGAFGTRWLQKNDYL